MIINKYFEKTKKNQLLFTLVVAVSVLWGWCFMYILPMN